MNKEIQTQVENIRSHDAQVQNRAYAFLMAATEKPVDWGYDAWEDLVEMLTDKDNHVRAISSQLLCNLAKSDPKNRMKKTFPKLLQVTQDERFVTARHCLQSLWKIGLVGKSQQKMVLAGLEGRFRDCGKEKNCTLIRYDILVGMRNLYNQVEDEKIRQTALELIDLEKDPKYVKKYHAVWKK